ncbi:MAG: tetratricopeptide repeat protein [Phycisphaerales bacterium]|nr:tetratricopeptide repeat protein [Phycisphaerales bacterium]
MNTRTLPMVLSALLVVALLTGCAGSGTVGPYNAPREDLRNPLEAQRLTRQAAELMEGDPVRAEEMLREALSCDLYHGPAHNNLGVLHLKRGELYEAANEFEWARKLMPGHPDPRLNLALTLERAGRIDEALAACDSALEVYPGHIAATQALASLQLRHRRADDRTRGRLEEIAMRGETAPWREWARLRLTLDRP